MASLLALLSAALWGSSDFEGGRISKRYPAISVLGATQLISLVFGLALTIAVGETEVTPKIFLAGAAAGLFGYIGLICLYAGLSTGRMGVVSPISSLSVLIPMTVALIGGETMSTLTAIGCALAIIGGFLTSGPEFSQGVSIKPLLLATGAALGFGSALTFMAIGAAEAPILTMVCMRIATAFVTIAIAIRKKGFGGLGRKNLPSLIFIGIADFAANAALGLAVNIGPVAISMVLGALYPVFTVLLAFFILHERLHKAQYIGGIAAVIGVALISAF
ncbi:MAG: DMT family transporter [Candidatus Nanopelagicaceae bacterium]|jgi:drug/metabolite transporter (DMT)-like permease|nr:DMT family transporter [Candidatus Nanopelagicaceae bacterium]